MSQQLFINENATPIAMHATQNLKEWFKGFSDESQPLENKGLLLKFCNRIQMKSCKIPLDIVFVNHKGIVVSTHGNIQPNSPNLGTLKACHCYELPVGSINQFSITVGSRLKVDEFYIF